MLKDGCLQKSGVPEVAIRDCAMNRKCNHQMSSPTGVFSSCLFVLPHCFQHPPRSDVFQGTWSTSFSRVVKTGGCKQRHEISVEATSTKARKLASGALVLLQIFACNTIKSQEADCNEARKPSFFHVLQRDAIG